MDMPKVKNSTAKKLKVSEGVSNSEK